MACKVHWYPNGNDNLSFLSDVFLARVSMLAIIERGKCFLIAGASSCARH